MPLASALLGLEADFSAWCWFGAWSPLCANLAATSSLGPPLLSRLGCLAKEQAAGEAQSPEASGGESVGASVL